MTLMLGLLGTGVVMLAIAWRLNKTSSLDGAQFILQILLIMAGTGCLAFFLLIGGAELFLRSAMGALMVAALCAAALGLVMVNAPSGGPPVANAGMALLIGGLAAFALLGLGTAVYGRDIDGRYAGSPLKSWFDGLRSGRGPCCSDADGTALSDVDWDTKDGHYRVRIDGEWLDVPDDAVITEPNRAGLTMVWPIRGYQGITIRCFMPGTMS